MFYADADYKTIGHFEGLLANRVRKKRRFLRAFVWPCIFCISKKFK
jgi:hypothetical protein